MIYLAYVIGPNGPRPQLWHKESEQAHFIGCAELKVVGQPRRIPDTVLVRDIKDALDWHYSNPEVKAA